jgi:hypothetical protein
MEWPSATKRLKKNGKSSLFPFPFQSFSQKLTEQIHLNRQLFGNLSLNPNPLPCFRDFPFVPPLPGFCFYNFRDSTLGQVATARCTVPGRCHSSAVLRIRLRPSTDVEESK